MIPFRFNRDLRFGRGRTDDTKPSKVKTYFLPLEEVHAKYGKPNPVKRRPDENTFVLNLVRKDKRKEGENK